MAPKATIFLWSDRALYIGPNMENHLHSHHAVQLSIGLQHDLHFQYPTENISVNGRLLLIDSDAPHQFHTKDQHVALLYLDSETKDAISIKNKILKSKPIVSLAFETVLNLLPYLSDLSHPSINCQEAKSICDGIIQKIMPGFPPEYHIDNRVMAVLKQLSNMEGQSVSVSELARSVGLSTSRLCHIFQKQIGFPIRRYFLWKKLIRAIRALELADTLTDAAHEAGFSDSAHMNRTFRKMFGIKPSFFLNHREFVRFLTCP
jgi:AraC-like DNA-binding protein